MKVIIDRLYMEETGKNQKTNYFQLSELKEIYTHYGLEENETFSLKEMIETNIQEALLNFTTISNYWDFGLEEDRSGGNKGLCLHWEIRLYNEKHPEIENIIDLFK